MSQNSINNNNNKNNRLKKTLKMIAVDKSNYDKLRQLGHVPESFNTIVGRLIAEHYQKVSTAGGGSIKTK
jgi:hypothetical protein